MENGITYTTTVLLFFLSLNVFGQIITIDTFDFYSLSEESRDISFRSYDSRLISKTTATSLTTYVDSPENMIAALRIADSYKKERELYNISIKNKNLPRKSQTHYNLLAKATDADLVFKLIFRIDAVINGHQLAFIKYRIIDHQHGYRYYSVKTLRQNDSKWKFTTAPPVTAIPFVLLHYDSAILEKILNEDTTEKDCFFNKTLSFRCLKNTALSELKETNTSNKKNILNKLREKI